MISQHSPYLKHIYVCVNCRETGACCANADGEAIRAKLKAFVNDNGLKGKVRVSGSGCMDLCSKGANVMVYPDHQWYGRVTLEGADRIIDEHLRPLLAHADRQNGKTPIRAFLFDLGNVLVRFDHMIFARKVTSRTNASPDELFRLFYDSPLVADHDLGKLSFQGFYERLKEAVSLQVSCDEFKMLWNSIFSENAEMVSLARQLMKRYPCILVSNTNRAHFDYCLNTYPFLEELTGWVLSYEVGVLKPHPDFYRRALELAGVAPSNAFYIDDRQDLIDAAHSLGFQTHRFSGDVKPLLNELKDRGIDQSLLRPV
ncbi:MAG: HAD-IA family hydrolase [Candidatus Omnitrophica bacterium]|nr:HAD-IA family hydrolase [Candidatus Omnitrophota bacterium]